MKDVKWLIRKYRLFVFAVLVLIAMGMFCFHRRHVRQVRQYKDGYLEADMDASNLAEISTRDQIKERDENTNKDEKAVRSEEKQNDEKASEDGIMVKDETTVKAQHATENETAAFSSDSADGFISRADTCLFTEAERKQLQKEALSAAETVGGIYRNAAVKEVPDTFSGVYALTDEQLRQVVEELGTGGLVSVGENTNMQNYEAVEAFYDEYRKGRDSMVTIFSVQRSGGLGAVTFIHRNSRVQTFYVGIRWEEGGIPEIEGTSVNDVAEMKLTEKGYLIYAYEKVIAHGSLRQYWRVKPLSEKCRELTDKYISGLSYVNYNMLVTNWDSGNVEEILLPRMFEDIYRIDTGKNLVTENWKIPAEQYERIMTTYFPVSAEQVRTCCGYEAAGDCYPYEMIYATPHPPFGEVIDYKEHEDGTVTLIVDGVWPDYNSDHAFTNRLLVQPFADGTFRYLSNSIEQVELEIPVVEASAGNRKMVLAQKELVENCKTKLLAGQKSVAQWANGYNLPVNQRERKEAEADCMDVMASLGELYEQAEKGDASNIVLSDETILEMRDKVGETGEPVYTNVLYADMANYEKMEYFLEACENGKKGTLVTYVIRRNGGIGRMKYAYDGTDMYVLSASVVWNKKAGQSVSITDISHTRMKDWRYSDKGWFCCELCVPEYPDVMETVNGSRLIRVRPMTKECREMSRKCVLGLGYQGNNLLCSNWDAEHLGELDYNGMYEYLYAIKYGKKFVPDADSPNGIPGEEFESLIMEYLPVTAEQIREYAVPAAYNEKNNRESQAYAWVGLGCGNYAPTFFGTSLPEVTDIKYNDDGTVTLTVDAVCDMILCDDAVITHELTVEFDDNGGFRYLGNEILDDGIRSIPRYQYRMNTFWEI